HTSMLGDNHHFHSCLTAQLIDPAVHRRSSPSDFRDSHHTNYRDIHNDVIPAPLWRNIMSTIDYSDFGQVQKSEQFQQLRRTHRSFVFPLTVVFLVWYLAFVTVAAFAPEFMAFTGWGNITIVIVLGLARFMPIFIIIRAHVSYADRKDHPSATQLRENRNDCSKWIAEEHDASDEQLTAKEASGEPAI